MKKLSLVLTLVFFVMSFAMAQRTITGTVSDESGETLIGASVLVQGTSSGTVTDFDGKYSLSVPADAKIIVFSYTGFSTKELPIGVSDVIDVVLLEGLTLQSVVVTALGIQREEKSLGYSIQKVDGEAIAQSGAINALDALNGKVAGVTITSSGGNAGSGTSVIIRGQSSITGNNQPLYVVDGIPIDNTESSSTESGGILYGAQQGANRASDINPDDIESITVLKGGAAAALYGSRAANGVVIITTKSGKGEQKGLGLEYGYSYGTSEANRLPEFNHNFARGRGGAYSNVTHWSWGPAYAASPTFPDGTSLDLNGDGESTDEGGNAIPLFKDNYKNFWQKGGIQKHNFSISNNSEKGNLLVSFSNLKQDGIVPNETYGRTSVSINTSAKVTDKLTVGAKANYIKTKGKHFQLARGISQGLGYWQHMYDINQPWIDANGDHTWFSTGVVAPQWVVNEEGENYGVDRIIGGVNLNYKITDKINVGYLLGADSYTDQRKEVRPFSSVETPNDAGDIAEIKLTSLSVNSDLIIRGQFNLSDDLDLGLMVGNNVFRNTSSRLYVRGDGIVLKGFDDITNTNERVVVKSDDGKMIVGMYGEATLGYKNFLYVGGTVRNDWSSTLPVDNNSYLYYSTNLGFVFSELMSSNLLSFGKIRASYSVVGNDAPTQSLRDVYSNITPQVGGFTRFAQSNSQNNPALKPEQSKEFEIGLDARFFKNKISLDLSYYKKNNVDQIIRVPLTATTGYNSYFANVGEIENKGLEIILGFNDLFTNGDFHWGVNFNFSQNKGVVLKVADGLDKIILRSGWWTNTELAVVENEAWGTIYGYAYQRNEAGDLLIDDNGYPISTDEKVAVGNINPDWILGITPSLSWKGISLNATLEYKKGGDVVNGSEANFIYSGLSATVAERFYSADDPNAHATKVFEGVRDNGDGTYSPNTIAAPLTNQFYQSNYINVDENIVEDATWWRLRNVTINYSLPESLLKSTKIIQGLSIYATLVNPWLKTNFKGIDPETSALGVNYPGFNELSSPNTKSVILGAKIKF